MKKCFLICSFFCSVLLIGCTAEPVYQNPSNISSVDNYINTNSESFKSAVLFQSPDSKVARVVQKNFRQIEIDKPLFLRHQVTVSVRASVKRKVALVQPSDQSALLTRLELSINYTIVRNFDQKLLLKHKATADGYYRNIGNIRSDLIAENSTVMALSKKVAQKLYYELMSTND